MGRIQTSVQCSTVAKCTPVGRRQLIRLWRGSHWTKWRPYQTNQPKEVVFRNLQLISTNNAMLLQWAACLPSVLVNEQDNCPIPTKSVCLTYHADRKLNEDYDYKLIKVVDFFGKCSDFLTCLSLDGIKRYASTLGKVFQNVPNLKAMTIKDVIIKKELSQHYKSDYSPTKHLPSLPNLEHLRLTSLISGVAKWLLKAYAPTIVSLEAEMIDLLNYLKTGPFTFPKMKQLKLFGDGLFRCTRFINAPNDTAALFPRMERVSLVRLGRELQWDDLVAFLVLFESSLAYFNLDFRSNGDTFQSSLSGQLLDGKTLEDSDLPKFLKLKVLETFYSRTVEEFGMFTQLLEISSNLETLKLYMYPFTDPINDKYAENDRNEENGDRRDEREDDGDNDDVLPDFDEWARKGLEDVKSKETFHYYCPDLQNIAIYRKMGKNTGYEVINVTL